MLKNLRELIDSKEQAIAELKKQEEKLKGDRFKAEQEIKEMEEAEQSIQKQLSILENTGDAYSVEVVLKDWIQYRNEYTTKEIDPLSKKLQVEKKAYLKTIENIFEKVEKLDQERKQLKGLLESNGANPSELAQFDIHQFGFRSGDLKKGLISNEDELFLELTLKIIH